MNQEYQHIIGKAAELYNKFGIRSVTMDDIARELGMSKKTLYKYVSNKEDLVQDFVVHFDKWGKCNMRDIIDRNLDTIEELIELIRCITEVLKNYNPATYYDLKKYYLDYYRQWRKERRNNIYLAMKENIVKGKSEGIYRKEIDEDIVSRVYVSRIANCFANEMFTISELTSWKFIREMLIYHIHAIANQNGISLFYQKLKVIENQSD